VLLQSDRFARDRLWCPLGVSEAEWFRHGSGVFVGASGLRLRPRDIARFGWMMLDDGRFAGRQIVPASYARAALEAQVSTDGGFTQSYGYLWWIQPTSTAAGEVDLALALGNGGQRIAVDRRATLLVVVTAGNYDVREQGDGAMRVIDTVERALGDALATPASAARGAAPE
jgi:CubicO group peptidase (beta-lactamase class C family)